MAPSEARVLKINGVGTLERPGPPPFNLRYVVDGPAEGPRVLVIPGGPGLASIVPYKGLRKKFAQAGFRVLMVEHRGIGASRLAVDGTDLPTAALTVDQVVDDMIAVLGEVGWADAYVYGTSYGGWLARKLAIAIPDRVRGMVLDSTGTPSVDFEDYRSLVRELFTGSGPLADDARQLIDRGLATDDQIVKIVAPVYEHGGTDLAGTLLRLRLSGHKIAWNLLDKATTVDFTKVLRYRMEPDLVGVIWSHEVDSTRPDGQPFDPARMFEAQTAKFGDYIGKPQNHRPVLAACTAPTLIAHGACDARAGRTAADRLAREVPNSIVLELPETGHSILDTRPRAAIELMRAVVNGTRSRISLQTGDLVARDKRTPMLILPKLAKSVIAIEAWPSRAWASFGRNRYGSR